MDGLIQASISARLSIRICPRDTAFSRIALTLIKPFCMSSVCRTQFRLTTLTGVFTPGEMYGIDYHFTTAKGWLSQRLLQDHRQYGFDPLMEYFDLYTPQVADGFNIRMGRYISVPDIEAQLAVNNYTYSHSLLFSYDPFTQIGIIGTMKLNDRWLVNVGLSAGSNIALWAAGAKPSLTACVAYTFNSGNDQIYPCASGINSGKYAYNNVQLFVTTWYHKFNKNWHMATEGYYEYERNVPGEEYRCNGNTAVDAAIQGAKTRMRPILMTSMAMVAGMIPMALGIGEGSQQTTPLGRAVIGGLSFATVATFLLLPLVFAVVQGHAGTTSPSLDPDDPESVFAKKD